MGRYIIQYVLPALVLLPALWWAARTWYVKRYGNQVKAQLKVRKQTAKYEAQLGMKKKSPTTKE